MNVVAGYPWESPAVTLVVTLQISRVPPSRIGDSRLPQSRKSAKTHEVDLRQSGCQLRPKQARAAHRRMAQRNGMSAN